MPQFLIGFWCGCVSATLVLCLLYANRKRQAEENARKAGPAAEKDSGGEGSATEESGICVLLVDDSKLSRTVMKEFLAKRGWKIFEAENGPECLRMVKKTGFDLIFLDQTMPGMSGDETLYNLLRDPGMNEGVPVVAVGSLIRKENEAKFCEKGYAACLGKPIQENRLDEIISQVFPQEEQVQRPEGFFYGKGLANFDGNEPVYRETLVLFADLWEERREELRRFLEEENMEEYAILIHAIKGDARTLGAEDFGELAYDQELRAKEGNIQAIRNGFDRVIAVGDNTAEYFRQMFS